MVKVLKRIVFVFVMFLSFSIVKAEQFKVGEYIEGEYIKMVSNNTTKYLTIQIIRDSNDNFVYCIEPFVLVDENEKDYVTYESDLSLYDDLTEEQKRRVSLLAYYGYGYKDRKTKKWYAITQMLIWRTVDPDSEFYFTDVPNGEKIDKYGGSINQILVDVYDHDKGPDYPLEYYADYGSDIVIDDFEQRYTFESSYDIDYGYGTYTIKDIVEDGTLSYVLNNKSIGDVAIFDSSNSQDLLRPGNVINPKYTINIYVNAGEITLDIRKDSSGIYSKQTDFTNTCYEISNKDTVLDKVCTSNDNLVYKTNKLSYGEYSIKQVSVGLGYEVDTNVYNVTIDDRSNKNIVLNNKMIKNKIELTKYYCIDDNCLYEENALFNVYDKDNVLVGSITTNSEGYGSLDVGYGVYKVVQEGGLENYTFVEEYEEDVINSVDRYYKELYNYFIDEDTGEFGTIIPDNMTDNKQDIDILLPPETGTKLAEIIKILYNVIMIVICSCNLKRFCYNN